jgi:hypothetical protein
MPATLSQTESQQLTALRAFLISILPIDQTQIVKGQVNRVAQPLNGDFVVYWPIQQRRLATNTNDYADNIFVGSIAGSILSVTELMQVEGELSAGITLTDGTAGNILANTQILSQLSGSPGGTGTYSVTNTQVLSAETLYAGVSDALVPMEWTVQLDVHGPNSANNAVIVEGLFRSEYGTTSFAASGQAGGYDIQPLYCDDARQMPFLNGEQQIEYRWTLDLRMQINPIVRTQQDFATALDVNIIEVDATYPP